MKSWQRVVAGALSIVVLVPAASVLALRLKPELSVLVLYEGLREHNKRVVHATMDTPRVLRGIADDLAAGKTSTPQGSLAALVFQGIAMELPIVGEKFLDSYLEQTTDTQTAGGVAAAGLAALTGTSPDKLDGLSFAFGKVQETGDRAAVDVLVSVPGTPEAVPLVALMERGPLFWKLVGLLGTDKLMAAAAR